MAVSGGCVESHDSQLESLSIHSAKLTWVAGSSHPPQCPGMFRVRSWQRLCHRPLASDERFDQFFVTTGQVSDEREWGIFRNPGKKTQDECEQAVFWTSRTNGFCESGAARHYSASARVTTPILAGKVDA